ncbi:MAG: transcription termination/antitermination protein NusA [Bacteroidales bacterium]|jgi:N utilization substance protein A|nr:transcription termination/antitermination protein NusA [Bacteroidales bacterium]MBP5214375.1 transcription termination/antitermination protein NusA [Bacteroidales bacterium]MBP5764552.1 transcription termination/antitermination protein NusA [Bacteroidales bacterium]
MAREKEEVMSMIDTFKEFKELKNIDRSTMISVLEDSFRSVLAKMFETDENFDIIINPDKGDFEIWKNRQVVADDELKNENLEVTLSEARQTVEDIEVGEDFTEKVQFEKFGRRAILNLRQTLAAKILELQKDILYNKYKDQIGQIISAEVYQIWKREMLMVDEEGNELSLPRNEQIPSDNFRKGDQVRAVVLRVDNANNNPKIILSRTAPVFLQRLMEREIPEVADGTIRIVKIVRLPGERAKIAVETSDDRIDPVGACVGVKGGRIHSIVRELRGENLDVIPYTTNTQLFIQRALAPASISMINLHDESKTAEVFMSPDQVSLAIGKNGANIKLASLLSGYTIDVYREGDSDDIFLDDFSDVIEPWVIQSLKGIGLATAKAVLEADPQMVADQADLEEETVADVRSILQKEFDQ